MSNKYFLAVVLFLKVCAAFAMEITTEQLSNIPLEKEQIIALSQINEIFANPKNLVRYSQGMSAFQNRIDYSSQNEVEKWLRTTSYRNLKPYLDKHKGSKPVNEGDWGSTFYELVAHDVDLLQQVARIYDARGERPLVLDLGCGYGFLAPLILAAGGQYHGVEQFENVAQIANKGIWATKTLWTQKDEDAKSLYKIKRASFIDTPLIEENKYDIIVLKNVLHFYSPSQCEQIITKVNRWLKKDGLLFAIADSPYREKEWLDYYQNNQASEIYPGFGVRNEPSIMHIYKFGQKYTRTEFLEAHQGLAPNFSRLLVVKVPETTLASGQRFNGYLSEASEVIDNYTDEVTWETAIRASTNTQGQRATLISWTHQVFNFFTTEQMNNIFKRHGFETQEAYYVDSFGSKIEQATTYLQSKASIITRKK